MALEFGFYDSYNHDRVYNAQNVNDILEGLITDGVYAGIGDCFMVRPNVGLQVTVGTGRAWFKTTWNKNRTLFPMKFDQADPVYSRIDILCIRVQKSIQVRANDFFVYKGEVLTTPQPPVLPQVDNVYYLPLAYVTIRPKAIEITESDIEMVVGREQCPYVTSILQQTDISELFKRWESQFTNWWDTLKEIMTSLDQGEIGPILAALDKKVDRSDKATSEDISLNSDNKWMTPAKTKEMIDESIGETIEGGVVNSFKGRKGNVVPQAGDYTPADVGALSTNGGTLSGNLNIGGELNVSKIRSATSIDFLLPGLAGSDNVNFKINGANPFTTKIKPERFFTGSCTLSTTTSANLPYSDRIIFFVLMATIETENVTTKRVLTFLVPLDRSELSGFVDSQVLSYGTIMYGSQYPPVPTSIVSCIYETVDLIKFSIATEGINESVFNNKVNSVSAKVYGYVI